MKIISDLKEANALLQLYSGATLQVYLFTGSLKRLILKLILPENSEVVYLIGVGCDRISGKFNWNNANLSITIYVSKETNETLTKIVDEIAGFELVTTGGFSLVKGLEKEFGTSFEDFIKDKT